MISFSNKYPFLILLSLLFSADVVWAQNGGFAGAATRIGFSPRAMSMANAFTASTSEGVYPYYNPALAATEQESRQIDLSVSSMQFDRVFQTAGVTFQLPPNAGLSVNLIRTGVKDIDSRSLSGYPLGTMDVAEYQLGTAFGIRFSDRFQSGISFKLNYANYHEDLSGATAVAVDIGLLYKISSAFRFGFAIQDLFSNYTWNSGDLYNVDQSRNVVNSFPTRYKWGLSYQHEKFSISSEFEVQAYSSEVRSKEIFVDDSSTPSVIESLETVSTSSGIFRIGGAWNAHERLTLRAGYKISDTSVQESGSPSAGFSIHLPFDTFRPSIDYAFIREPYGVANMHVFALRLHL